MQILINGYFWAQPTVGSGQYLHGLLEHLPQLATQHEVIVARPARQGDGPVLPAGVRELRLTTPFDRQPQLAKIAFEQLALPRAAAQPARRAETVLFIPYLGGPYHCTVPVVTTVGDLIPLVLPEYRGRAAVRAYTALAIASARRSRALLTFSQFSRHELITRLGVPAESVTSILLAATAAYRPAEQAEDLQQFLQQRYGLSGPYVYYVGGLDARKNVLTLIDAWARLPERLQQTQLVIAGRALGRSTTLFPDIDSRIAQLGLSGRIRRLDVPAQDGPRLYQGAQAFVFPSRYEGFGLPPLEAMACGTPVICSDAGPLGEVVGDAALTAAPDDTAGWAAALTRVLDDAELRAALRQRGIARAAQFSYAAAAAATLAVLERVINR